MHQVQANVSEVFERVSGGGGVEVDEGDGAAVGENGVVGPGVVVADDRVRSGECAASGGIMQPA